MYFFWQKSHWNFVVCRVVPVYYVTGKKMWSYLSKDHFIFPKTLPLDANHIWWKWRCKLNSPGMKERLKNLLLFLQPPSPPIFCELKKLFCYSSKHFNLTLLVLHIIHLHTEIQNYWQWFSAWRPAILTAFHGFPWLIQTEASIVP
jgi:hypothetical protein